MELLSKNDAAKLLGVTVRTIDNLVGTGVLPAPKPVGRHVYWLKHEFEEYLQSILSIEDPKRSAD